MDDQGETVHVEPGWQGPFSLELLDVATEQLHSILQPITDLGAIWPAAQGVRLCVEGERLEIRSERSDLPKGPLKEGDELRFDELLLRLVAVQQRPFLQALNEPQRGQVWSIGPRSNTLLGRSGKRINHITLEDQTVSRAHATIQRQAECFFLLIEAKAASYLNGSPLSPGQSVGLKDGDLIRLGNSLLGFYQPQINLNSKPKMRIYSLGRFEVQLGAAHVRGDQWRSHLSRFVLAYVAAEWPSAVVVERLLDMFWPEMEPERARNNLRTALTNLRSQLKIGAQGALFARTTQTIEFDPQLEVWHDLRELRQLLLQARQTQGDQRFQLQAQALELYRGKYLEDCYFEFAERLRDTLERELVGVACELLEHYSLKLCWSQVLQVGQQALLLDACCQEAYLAMMRAARSLNRPEESLRLYEACRRALQRELAVEPNLEIEREHQLARLGL